MVRWHFVIMSEIWEQYYWCRLFAALRIWDLIWMSRIAEPDPKSSISFSSLKCFNFIGQKHESGDSEKTKIRIKYITDPSVFNNNLKGIKKHCWGSRMFIPEPDPNCFIPDPGSKRSQIRIKEFRYFQPKNLFSKLSEIPVWSGFFSYPGSLIQGSKKHRMLIRNTVIK